MLTQKVFINGTEVPGATADLGPWEFDRQTSVVKGKTRLISGAMANSANLRIDRPISDDPSFATLAKDRKASNHIVVQVYTTDELIREFTFVEAVVGTYFPLGFNETESVLFETSAEPTVTCGAPVLG